MEDSKFKDSLDYIEQDSLKKPEWSYEFLCSHLYLVKEWEP